MDWYIFQSTTRGELDVCSERYASTEEADGRLEELLTGSHEDRARWMRLGPDGAIASTSGWQSSIVRRTGSEITNQSGPSQSATQELLRELDLLRNEVATYRECGIVRMETLAALIADQARELGNIDAGEKSRR